MLAFDMQELPEDKGEALAPLPSNWVALRGFISLSQLNLNKEKRAGVFGFF